MVNHGRVQLVRISEVDDAVDRAKEELKQALVMIENLNEPFIRESRKLNEDGFSGQFHDGFMEKIDEEEKMTKQLNEDNLDRIQQLTNQLDSAMMESSSQHYTYATELVPVTRTKGRSEER